MKGEFRGEMCSRQRSQNVQRGRREHGLLKGACHKSTVAGVECSWALNAIHVYTQKVGFFF